MGKVTRAVKSVTLCVRPRTKADTSIIGREGFNRQVRCNNATWNVQKFGYASNAISTTKYNMFTFLPKALFEQFRRLANVFFLAQAALSLIPDVTPFNPVTLIGPLVLVVGVSIAKEWLEDFRRFQLDAQVNARKVKAHVGGGVFEARRWRDLRVGDVVMVEKNAFFPADLLMLSSSNNEAMCYVETMNLDGETNLKPKKAIQETIHLNTPEVFRDWQATIQCEQPNPSLYTFVANLDLSTGIGGGGLGLGGGGGGGGVGVGVAGGGRVFSLGPANLLLRDSKLRNTSWVYGVVVFTGHDTKVMQNATEPPSKRSRLEKQMDYVIIVLFCTLLVISIISGLVYGVWLDTLVPAFWYLAPGEMETVTFNTQKPTQSGLALLVTSLILYGYLIPISLYVSIEMVKMVQAMFINQDIRMYHEDTSTWARARTSNLNEELGQVETVLSDKTGTLTCNVMEFLKCSIAGVSYGRGVTEVERATAKRLGKLLKVEEEGEDVMEASGGGTGLEGALLLQKSQQQQQQWIEVSGDTDSEISGGLGGVIGRTGKMEPHSARSSEGGTGDWMTTSSTIMTSVEETDEDDRSRGGLRDGGKKKKKRKGISGWAVAKKHFHQSNSSSMSFSSSLSRPFKKKLAGAEKKKKDKHRVKGFNFKDERLLKGNWMKQSNREQIRMFFRILSVCHTVVPEVDDSSGELKYEAESPDEAAFVIAAQQFGFVFVKRTPSGVHIIEPMEDAGETPPADQHHRVYNVLAALEFNSTRKRMSVIVRDPENQIILMCKGADSVIYERLSVAGRKYASVTAEHLKQYGEAGLRTLALSYRILSEEEYHNWNTTFQEAKTTVGPERDAKVDEAAEAIERELLLVGATGVEDKLQPGVPEAIDRLAQAGLKIWVLTGDKVETAINIGYAASLLRTGMTQIVISLDSAEVKAAEEEGDKHKLFQVAIAIVTTQIADGLDLIRAGQEGRNGVKHGEEPVYALVIDGRALTFALDDSLKDKFLELAVGCASVICCRVSPKQKALTVRCGGHSDGHAMFDRRRLNDAQRWEIQMEGGSDDGRAKLTAIKKTAVAAAVMTMLFRCQQDRVLGRMRAQIRPRRRKMLHQVPVEGLDTVAITEAAVQVCCTMGCSVFPRATPRWWMKRRTGGAWEDLRKCDDVTEYLWEDLRKCHVFQAMAIASTVDERPQDALPMSMSIPRLLCSRLR
ncbi:GT47-family glycosyltransferase [Chara braunii]|uniref:Phospholipid-transporting ATPase n=1 Tax=Chara braunii TaxID=69332 RepID=A0A388LQ26_CHABU|nr:GT47-family glycosyltransferase [Chara braunii]|eukprot:GBG84313.1 GT47-family glycosyltransferase [Chara braunii]